MTAATIGNINRMPGQIVRATTDGLYSVLTELGEIKCPLPQELKEVDEVVVAFRPEDIVLDINSCTHTLIFGQGRWNTCFM